MFLIRFVMDWLSIVIKIKFKDDVFFFCFEKKEKQTKKKRPPTKRRRKKIWKDYGGNRMLVCRIYHCSAVETIQRRQQQQHKKTCGHMSYIKMIGVFTATKYYEIKTGQFIVNTTRIKDRQINKYQLMFFLLCLHSSASKSSKMTYY